MGQEQERCKVCEDWRRRALEAEARERWVPVGEGLPPEGAAVEGVIHTENLGAVRTVFTFTNSQWVSLGNRRYPLEAVHQWKPFHPAAPEVP